MPEGKPSKGTGWENAALVAGPTEVETPSATLLSPVAVTLMAPLAATHPWNPLGRLLQERLDLYLQRRAYVEGK